METVLICGGTGLIGQNLKRSLQQKGYRVIILSRNPGNQYHDKWNPQEYQFPKQYLKQVHHIINLSGENINQRWTKEAKKRIYSSRIQSTAFLYQLLSENEHSVLSFINAGGISIYGDRGDLVLTEKDAPGTDYLAKLCVDWEQEAEKIRALGVRTNIVRISPVLSPDGGLIKVLSPIAKSGILNAFGNGKQFFPWIHMEDLCNIFLFCLKNTEANDVWNACSPKNTRQDEFNKELCETLHKPYFMPAIPSKMVRLIFGDRSQLFLDSICARPENLIDKGFLFKFADLKDAMTNVLSPKKS